MTQQDSHGFRGLGLAHWPELPYLSARFTQKQPQHLQHRGAGNHRGVVVVEVVKMEVNALIQNVEPELVACAAVLVAYAACAAAFVSHFL